MVIKAEKKLKKILSQESSNLILALTTEDSRMSCAEPQKGLKGVQAGLWGC